MPPMPPTTLPRLDDLMPGGRRHFLARMGALGLVLGGCASRPVAPALPASSVPDRIAPFSAGELGAVPAGWAPYKMLGSKPDSHYAVAEVAGRKVLEGLADTDGGASALECPLSVALGAETTLSWRWMSHTVPKEARSDDSDLDDAAARVVVSFEGPVDQLSLKDRLFYEMVHTFTGKQLPYATLIYVWDSQLPVGSVVPYGRTSRIQFLVVQSGTSQCGQWMPHERRLAQDYAQVWHEPVPPRLSSVGVMVDSDDLHQRQVTWFDDLQVR